MDPEMKMAIEGSIRKWGKACAGKLSFYWIGKYCELCKWTLLESGEFCEDSCANICPLGEIEQCNDAESTFHKILVKISDNEHNIYDTVDDHPELSPLFEKMLSMLKGLLADGE